MDLLQVYLFWGTREGKIRKRKKEQRRGKEKGDALKCILSQSKGCGQRSFLLASFAEASFHRCIVHELEERSHTTAL